MQFGKLCGLGLIVLGLILCALQFLPRLAPPNKEAVSTQTETRTATKPEHETSLPGIVGAASLLAGIALFATARRKDEPAPEHRVK
jgi:hypothetical protein